MHNTSLVGFTLLIQIGVGVFGTTLFNTWMIKEGGMHIPFMTLSVCLGLIVLGLISATAHLKNPINAPYAVSNIRHSWLSREIVSVNLLAACIGLLWVLTWAGTRNGVFFHMKAHTNMGISATYNGSALSGFVAANLAVIMPVIEIVALISGISAVWTMSRVYALRTVPAWNHLSTPVDFFGTALISGGIASAILDLIIPDHASMPGVTYLVVSGLGLLCKIISVCLTLSVQQRSKTKFWYASARAETFGHAPAYVGLSFLYTSGFFVFVAGCIDGAENRLPLWFLSLGIVLLAEIWHRFRFYGSFCRLGL